MSAFFRFPHTPHLAWLSPGQPREDKVLSTAEANDFLCAQLIMEEKVDGANLGFSVDGNGVFRVQNRGQYLEKPFLGQFKPLGEWLARHQSALEDALFPDCMLFGEWCYARHSLDYDRLPDWFLGFDVFDRAAGRFWSTARRDALLAALGLPRVARVDAGSFRLDQLRQRLSRTASAYRAGPVEGFVLRRDGGEWCEARAKLVQPGFVQNIGTHWSSMPLVPNGIRTEKPEAHQRDTTTQRSLTPTDR